MHKDELKRRGLVAMPIEPTPEILNAFDAAYHATELERVAPIRKYREEVYKAMLAATPSDEEHTERALEAIAPPDNGSTHEVLSAVLACANAWAPDARIIGNVRAGDISRALSALVEEQPVAVKAEQTQKRVEGLTKTQIETLANNIHNVNEYAYTVECLTYHCSPRSALADVPAVEPEPVAWQPKYKQNVIDHHRSIGSDLWEYAMTVYPTKVQAEGYGYGGHEARPLYASPVLSAIAPAHAEETWQPIETAPEKGQFLAYGAYLYPDDKDVTEYTSIVERSGDPAWPWETSEGNAAKEAFTHWRPLPAPPSLVHAEDGMAHGSTSSSKGCAE